MDPKNIFNILISPVLFSILIFRQAWTLAFIALLLIILLNYRRIYVIILTLPRDLTFMHRFYLITSHCKRYKKGNKTIASVFSDTLRKNPERICFYFENEIWRANQVEEYSNRVAKVFYNEGFKKGDVVALLMHNRPEYACIWLGLSKIGVVAALINTNLKKKTLLHCIKSCNSKALIYTDQFTSVLEEIKYELSNDFKLYQIFGDFHGEIKNVINLTTLINEATADKVLIKNPPEYTDHLMYIFTSGTTGLPKAAIMPHSRFLLAAAAYTCILNITHKDIIYNPLPLYHSAGGALGIGTALINDSSVVIKTKFSASSFFSDCIKYNCTIAQYIGEMCRYVLATPVNPNESKHKMRTIIGNGMKPSIWPKFVSRFKIPHVTEVYGATEGNVNICNIDNTVGAIGFFPRCLPQAIFPKAIIKVDKETGEPFRNEKGFCEHCAIDEPGMLIGIIKQGDPKDQFHGYVEKESSKKKILENVFKRGDKAFNTGDLVTMNELGYIFFKDRTGDTFRWKGENVATTEVEAIISNVLNLQDCTVYGVQVGDLEGKAGMAAIADPSGQINLERLAQGLDHELPVYAQPIFIRLLHSVELTGTFKIRKINLQEEGFNPNVVKDKLFLRKGKSFVPITPEIYNDIIEGRERL